MNVTRQQMAAIFNEWARRYAEKPGDFSEVLDEEGRPVVDYGERCARYFEQIAGGMGPAL